MTTLTMRLWLVGDDEVLDAIADLSRHLDYFQVARIDELPEPPLSAHDHVVVAMEDEARGRDLAARVHTLGSPGHVMIVPSLPGKSSGARAIVAAAELVALL
ncbi:MAG: hypothetical protein JWN44_3925 [Myxococcales bacterium]|nr:hypothetical protein [Myxococcales bacterium]